MRVPPWIAAAACALCLTCQIVGDKRGLDLARHGDRIAPLIRVGRLDVCGFIHFREQMRPAQHVVMPFFAYRAQALRRACAGGATGIGRRFLRDLALLLAQVLPHVLAPGDDWVGLPVE